MEQNEGIHRIERKKFLIGYFLAVMFFGLALSSCVPPSGENNYHDSVQDFSVPLTKVIYNLQNRQDLDSLKYYMAHPDPMARFCAVRAFGSIIDKQAIAPIARALQDSVFEIRAEAAYVAGQQRDSSLVDALLDAFETNKSKEVDHLLNRNILEAVGKIGSEVHLNYLTNSSPYPKKYVLLNEGKAHAIYQFALRGMTTEKGTAEMVRFLTEEYGGSATLIAAHYLQRAKNIDIDSHKFQLLQAMIRSEDPNVGMCLASALGKSGSTDVLSTYIGFLKKESDPRVIINGLRQSNDFPYIEMIDHILALLNHKNDQVAIEAANWIGRNGKPADYRFYVDYVDKVNDANVQIAIKGSVLKLLGQNYPNTRGKIVSELKTAFESKSNPYEKAFILQSLGANPYLYQTVYDLAFPDSALVVKSKGVEILGSILTDYLPSQSRGVQRYYAPIIMNFLNEALQSRDIGMIAASAYSIYAADNELVKARIDSALLAQAYSELSMPADIEAINYCIQAINKHIPGAAIPLKISDNLRTFDMNTLEVLGRDPIAVISTSQGDIRVKLFTNHAPATVMNFVDLAQQGYYVDKVVHRVVSNFVLQTGCPRGDGYGSEDYTIRSELSPLNYLESGYIGMASAGKHTESTQWFITHSPTPHLSGNYTIFGKVEGGMDVANSIRVGDQIQGINIIKDMVNVPLETEQETEQETDENN